MLDAIGSYFPPESYPTLIAIAIAFGVGALILGVVRLLVWLIDRE